MKITAKELKAEIKTVAELSSDKTIIKLCDILVDIVEALKKDDGIVFKS